MRALTVLATIAATLLTVGCAEAAAPQTEPSTSASETASAAPDPNSIEGRLAVFQQVLSDVDASQEVPDGEAAIVALEAAGFVRADMERTGDLDSLGQPVTLLEIAVRIEDQCLVGQIGQGEPDAIIVPVLSSGTCLIGETVPVD